jgi:hypothetical protein
MWRRDTENKDIEHQESVRELITINEKTNSIQAISQNGAVPIVCKKYGNLNIIH